jgi:uncharacterized cupin superfamily protein
MRKVNPQTTDFRRDDDPEGFRAGIIRPGSDWSATKTGASFYELPAGQSICPYHYEWAEEEWLFVIEGRPTLRDPDGEHALEAGDLVFFPIGPDGAHKVTNRTDATVRVLMFSNIEQPAVTVYPDSDKIGVHTGGDRSDNVMVRRESGGLDYYDGEL